MPHPPYGYRVTTSFTINDEIGSSHVDNLVQGLNDLDFTANSKAAAIRLGMALIAQLTISWRVQTRAPPQKLALNRIRKGTNCAL